MGTWVVGAMVLAAAVLAARRVYKDRQSGNNCGCGCAGCAGRPAKPGNQKSI